MVTFARRAKAHFVTPQCPGDMAFRVIISLNAILDISEFKDNSRAALP